MSKATRPGIARVSVKQYAEVTQRSTQRVNKLLQDLETIGKADGRDSKRRMERKKASLPGMVDFEWVGNQRVLTINLQDAGGFICPVCETVIKIQNKVNDSGYCMECEEFKTDLELAFEHIQIK